MRKYHFTSRQIEKAKSVLDKLPKEWLAAALALASRYGKTPAEAATVLASAAGGHPSAWHKLRAEYRVQWHNIKPPIPQDKNGNVDLFSDANRTSVAQAALLAFLVDEYDLNEPSTEEQLVARVEQLERQVAALQAGAATPAIA